MGIVCIKAGSSEKNKNDRVTSDSIKTDINNANKHEPENAAKTSQAPDDYPDKPESTKAGIDDTNKHEPSLSATTSQEKASNDIPEKPESDKTGVNDTNKHEQTLAAATSEDKASDDIPVTNDPTKTGTNDTNKTEANNTVTHEQAQKSSEAVSVEEINLQLKVTNDSPETDTNATTKTEANNTVTNGQAQESSEDVGSEHVNNAQGSSQSSPTAGRAPAHSDSDSLGSESSKHATSENLQEPSQLSQNVDKQLEKANQEITKLRFALKEKTREVENLQSEQKQPTVKKDMKKLKDKELREQYQRALTEKERLEEKLKQEKKEKEEVLLRLSAEAATKLTHNNPQVTDLSDENRATKLSEKFSELYDNQWTDAFETLVNDGKHSDRDAIDILLSTLLNISNTCVEKSKQDMQRLKDIISEFGGEDKEGAVSKGLLERRKHRFGHTLQELTTSIKENLDADGKVAFTASPIYIDNCIKLCWLMAIQDPPLHIGRPDPQKCGHFDKGLFKSYTKDGDEIDYVVWPALFLHHDGPLLCKGVAQAKGKEENTMRPITPEKDEVIDSDVAEVKEETPLDKSTKVEESDIKKQHLITNQDLSDTSYDKSNQTTNELAQINETYDLESEGQSVKSIVQTAENAGGPQNRSLATLAKEEHPNSSVVVDHDAKQDLASKLHDEENQVEEQVEQTTTNKQNETEEQTRRSPIQNQNAEVRGVDDVNDTDKISNQEPEQAVETVAAVDEIELRTETLENQYNELHVVANTTENKNENLTSVEKKDENTDHSVSHLDVSQDENKNKNNSLKEEASTTSHQSMVSSSEHDNEQQTQPISFSNNVMENKDKSTEVRTDSEMDKAKSTEDNRNENAEHILTTNIPSQEVRPMAIITEPTNKTTKQINDNVIRDQTKSSNTDVFVQKGNLKPTSPNKAGDSYSKSTREQSTNIQSNVSQDSSKNSSPEMTPTVARAWFNKLSTGDEGGNNDKNARIQDKPVSSKQTDASKLPKGIGKGGTDDNKKLPAIPTSNRKIVDNEGKPFNVISKTLSGASSKSDSNRSSTNATKLDILVTGTKQASPRRGKGHTAPVGNDTEEVPKGKVKALCNQFMS